MMRSLYWCLIHPNKSDAVWSLINFAKYHEPDLFLGRPRGDLTCGLFNTVTPEQSEEIARYRRRRAIYYPET
jgi:hypothetical protein